MNPQEQLRKDLQTALPPIRAALMHLPVRPAPMQPQVKTAPTQGLLRIHRTALSLLNNRDTDRAGNVC